MRVTGTTIASWWLSEHSTPQALEERLLAAGLRPGGGRLPDRRDAPHRRRRPRRAPGSKRAPSPPPTSTSRRCEAQYEAFGTPAETAARGLDLLHRQVRARPRRRCRPRLLRLARRRDRRCGARLVQSHRACCVSGGCTLRWARGRGVYRALVRARWEDAAARGTPALAVAGGARRSAPILRRLGFEKICQFRRLGGRSLPG